jgi:hypothetical protein
VKKINNSFFFFSDLSLDSVNEYFLKNSISFEFDNKNNLPKYKKKKKKDIENNHDDHNDDNDKMLNEVRL